jgi:hypothetical protein
MLKQYYNQAVGILSNVAIRGLCIYILIITIHYVTANIYPYFCTPRTILGLFLTPFLALSPQCEGLRWIVYNTGIQIRNMWVWVASYLLHFIHQYCFS